MDIAIGVSILLCLGVVAAAVGAWCGRHRHATMRLAIPVLVPICGALYFLFLWDRPLLAWLFPYSTLPFLANWLPVLGAAVVGALLVQKTLPRSRRLVGAVVVGSLCLYSAVSPVLGTVPVCRDIRHRAGFSVQSTPHTCSPAAAASLLRLNGIDAGEQEMAELCLTRRGTHWTGVVRGLLQKCRGTGFEVTVAPLDVSRAAESLDGTGLVCLNFSGKSARQSGFDAAAGHTLLLLGRNSANTVRFFDPAPGYGIQLWNQECFEEASGGIVIRIVSAD